MDDIIGGRGDGASGRDENRSLNSGDTPELLLTSTTTAPPLVAPRDLDPSAKATAAVVNTASANYIAPTPTIPEPQFYPDAPLSHLDTTANTLHIHDAKITRSGTDRAHSPATPLSSGLKLQTDFGGPHCTISPATANSNTAPNSGIRQGQSSNNNNYPPLSNPPPGPHRTPSLKAGFSAGTTLAGSLSPASALSSPGLGPMADITPLPSPLISSDSPGPWNRMGMTSRPGSRGSGYRSASAADGVTDNTSVEGLNVAAQQKRKTYQGVKNAAGEGSTPLIHSTSTKQDGLVAGHGRNRSVSEYVPENQKPRPRMITVSSAGGPVSAVEAIVSEPHLKREPCLAVERGLVGRTGVDDVPTPPPSHRGVESSDSDSSLSSTLLDKTEGRMVKRPRYEYYDAVAVKDGKRRRWRSLYQLGQGTFSKVYLATSQDRQENGKIDEYQAFEIEINSTDTTGLDLKTLVAVKIIEHGPAGGASEERIESSLKRELDILKSIHHPNLVHLKAFNVERTRALLVLTYCAGGDLFDMASMHHKLLAPSLVRRIFAELTSAVQYLHSHNIVHRDIKLENVLLNLPYSQLSRETDWQTYPYPVSTLTDLGLSRHLPPPPSLLTTRCGSEDYAAPELLMGQPYDGRLTDAWALGVLLYAVLEARLPFDPLPGVTDLAKARSRTAHRIARCEWRWVRFADAEGEPMPDFGDWEGARKVVEGFLRRSRNRLRVQEVAGWEWVKGGIQVEGGVRWREESDGGEVVD